MKKMVIAAFIMVLVGSSHALIAQQFASYYSQNFFLMGSPGSFHNGLLGFTNPANTEMVKNLNMRFYWSANEQFDNDVRNWGVFTAAPGLGFGVMHKKDDRGSVTDYRISLARGSKTAAFGLSYSWSSGDKNSFERQKLLSAGLLFRPLRFISLGMVGNFSTETSAREGVVELAVRPLGNRRFTIFGDYAIQKNQKIADAPWSVGAAVEVLPGVNIAGRYFDNEAFTVGLNFSFGRAFIGAQGHYDENQDHNFNTYSVGVGDYTPNLFSSFFFKKKAYVAFNLKGRVDYQTYKWFDVNTRRFMDILQDIRNAVKDPRVEVLALNLSGMRVLPEHAWEIREELIFAREAGKKVIIFIDTAGMTGYHLSSVADVVMMDPQGSLMLPGYVMGRTYLKGTLDKLELGFDEWRFFKYKSAAEVLSREDMSEADREQTQAFTDDMYDLIKQDVSESRNITAEEFDRIINESVYFLPDDALEAGLVDTLCRWSSLKEVVKSLTGKKKIKLPVELLTEAADTYQEWGEPPQIALVYGLGVCAMDEGIKARWMENVFLKLADKKSVKAVVFRVDSPGGDGMASDVVAEALRICAKEKPVIVSQGQVAASGGYWISMYGDTILAGPTTITGSIGVIGGWIYDKGFSGKLGMTSDHVKRGDHADLGFGVRLPLLGIRIPARNLTEAERSRVEGFIRRLYDDFVNKVADGRGMTPEAVDDIGQGRIYSGTDGKQNGLVDDIGGLYPAIELARKMAKISDKERYRVVEIPKYKGFFNTEMFTPSVQKAVEEDPAIQFIKMVSERPGYPLPLLPPGFYPTLDGEEK
jgi:protease-4